MPLRAFFITPFSPETAGNEDPHVFAAVQDAVRTAASAVGVELVHPNVMTEPGTVMAQVAQQIIQADVVLANLTGKNANVFFELGRVPHVGWADCPAILIASSADDVPFDVRHLRYFTYGGTGELATLASRLERSIRDVLAARASVIISNAGLRAAFDPLILNRTSLFAGRGEEVSELRKILDDPSGGYVLVTAPGGFGKTALLAHFAAENPGVAYHFFSPSMVPESVDEDFFLRTVLEQLVQWYGSKIEPPRLLPELRALFQTLLSRPLDRPRALILDGVDEVTTWRLEPYLSRSLPRGFHMIVSARDIGRDWREALGMPAGQTRSLTLHGLSRTAIAQVLRAAGGAAPALADDANLLDELMKVAHSPLDLLGGADPFYVRFLAEDAAAGLLTQQNLRQKPRGLEQYLDAWWQEISDIATDEPIRDLFGTLAVAIGPISQADLEAINPSLTDAWAIDFFDKVIERARRFVMGNRENGYALHLPRLREYLQKRIRTAQYAERVLMYCRHWERTQSRYALRYYAQHLDQAGMREELISLCIGSAFFETVRRLLPAESYLTARTARLALTGAIARNDPAIIARLLIVHAHEIQAASIDISPLQLAGAGSLDAAWNAMDLLDAQLASLWHLLVAWDLRERGRLDDARGTLVRLERKQPGLFTGWLWEDLIPLLLEAVTLDEGSFLRLLRALLPQESDYWFTAACNLAEQGRGKFALLTARAIRDDYTRAEALGRIVHAEPALLSEAVEAAESINEPGAQAWALGMFAEIADDGQRRARFDRAIALLEQVTEPSAFTKVKAVIAVSEWRSADVARAHEHISDAAKHAKVLADDRQSDALQLLASALAEIGELDKALLVVQTLDEPEERDDALQSVAERYVKRANTRTAQDTIELQSSEERKVVALAHLSTLAANHNNDLEGARKLFEAAANRLGRLTVEERSSVLPALGACALLRRDRGLAARFVEEIEKDPLMWADAASEARAHLSIGLASQGTGRISDAINHLAQALEAALRVEEDSQRDIIVNRLGDAAVGASETALLKDLVRGFRADRDQHWENGDFQRAYWANDVLGAMVTKLANAAQFDRALDVAELVRNRPHIRALGAVAARQARSGRVEARATYARALEAYRRLQERADKAHAADARSTTQRALVEYRLSQDNNYQSALTMARRIDDREERVVCLGMIASSIAKRGNTTTARDVFLEAEAVAHGIQDGWEDSASSEPPWRWAGTARVTLFPNPVAAAPWLGWVAAAMVTEAGLLNEGRDLLTSAIGSAQRIASKNRRDRVLEIIANTVEGTPELLAALRALAPDLIIEESCNEAASNGEATQVEELTACKKYAAAVECADRIADPEERNVALSEIAERQAEDQQFDGAERTAEMIDDQEVRASALGTIALEMARNGLADDAVRVSQHVLLKLVKSHWSTLPVAEALAEKGDREHVSQLLFACAQRLSTAYGACRVLAQLYPASIEPIFTVLSDSPKIACPTGPV